MSLLVVLFNIIIIKNNLLTRFFSVYNFLRYLFIKIQNPLKSCQIVLNEIKQDFFSILLFKNNLGWTIIILLIAR